MIWEDSYQSYLTEHLTYFKRGYKVTFRTKNITVDVESSFWVSQNFLHVLSN